MDDMRSYLDLFFWVVLGIIVGTAIYVIVGYVAVDGAQDQLTNITQNDSDENTSDQIIILTKDIEIIHITTDCSNCNSTTYLIDQLMTVQGDFNFKFNIKEVSFDSAEAETLIEKYSIEKLPSMIVDKEATSNTQFTNVWTERVGTRESDDSLVFRSNYPPYYDIETNEVIGSVIAYNIMPRDCDVCENLSLYFDYLASDEVMVSFEERHEIYEDSELGQEFITKYNITKLPTFVFSDAIEAYPISEQILEYSNKTDDGYVILRDPYPPYVDLEDNGSVKGLVTMKKLVDGNCTTCFDIDLLSSGIVSTFNLYLHDEVTYDINSTEGQALLEQYNITAVPTVLVSPEASAYVGFEEGWATSDSVESDGWYVYRSHELVDGLPYNDLTTE